MSLSKNKILRNNTVDGLSKWTKMCSTLYHRGKVASCFPKLSPLQYWGLQEGTPFLVISWLCLLKHNIIVKPHLSVAIPKKKKSFPTQNLHSQISQTCNTHNRYIFCETILPSSVHIYLPTHCFRTKYFLPLYNKDI